MNPLLICSCPSHISRQIQSFINLLLLHFHVQEWAGGQTWNLNSTGLPWWLRQWRVCLQSRRPGFNPWDGMIPGRKKWQPTPVFSLGKSRGRRSLAGYMGSQSQTRLSDFTISSWFYKPLNYDQVAQVLFLVWKMKCHCKNEHSNSTFFSRGSGKC